MGGEQQQGRSAQAPEGVPQRAVQLYGGSDALREALSVPRPVAGCAAFETHTAAASAALGEERFAAAWGAGCGMTVEAAIA